MHMQNVVPILVAALCAAAAVVWGRSARRLKRALHRVEREIARSGGGPEAADLARSSYRKELHTTLLYGILALVLAVAGGLGRPWTTLSVVAVAVPVAMSLGYGRGFLNEASIAEQRATLLRRAEEVLQQDDLAPRRWAERLAPSELPTVEGFDIGRVYEPGTGAMAGDFYDFYRTSPSRLAAVIGDVTGHGIEPSITAFQVKYLLRVLLQQYRDPAQAMEELNRVMYSSAQPEEFVSMFVALFDLDMGTVRTCSAGHPPAWLFHDGDVRPLSANGPLLALDPKGTYGSREVPLEEGDLLVLYTDGLTEARAGENLFGDERVAAILRRDPGREPEYLCKALLEAARDFADGPLSDDVAILAIRRA